LQKYDWPTKITDETIKDAFSNADSVSLSVRHSNYISYRFIAFGDLGWWLPLMRVLPLIGITPQILRPVFNPQWKTVKRRFPLNHKWFGLNKKTVKTVEIELPEVIETYEQLGSFPLAEKPFQELARILGKSVEVMREDGSTGEHHHLFTVRPFGEIIKASI
jgi:hypothetical protein